MTGLARLAPRHIAEWHRRRLLTVAYRNWRVLLGWFADPGIAVLPPPGDKVCCLVVGSTCKDQTGQQHPSAKRGRLNEDAPYLFGLPSAVVMLHRGNYRLPVDVESVRGKDDPRYRSEHRLSRRRLVRFHRPPWAAMVVVIADAAFAATANLQLIQRRGYGFVMAFARPWCVDHGHALRALGTQVPQKR